MNKTMTMHTSGGIENLVRDAAAERAHIAELQSTADQPAVVDDHKIEVEATKAYLTEALKLAHEKYSKASLFKGELHIVEQAIENTLERVTRMFDRE